MNRANYNNVSNQELISRLNTAERMRDHYLHGVIPTTADARARMRSYANGYQQVINEMMGELRRRQDEYARIMHMEDKNEEFRGRGIFGDFFSVKLDYNNASKRTINTYGGKIITAIELRRHPIPSAISSALKWFTKDKDIGYDTFYHLSVIVTVEGGTKIIIEKNEVVNVNTEFESSHNDEYLRLDVPSIMYLEQVLELTRKRMGDEAYFTYNSFTNNCQWYDREICISMHAYTKEAEEFLFQDLSRLMDNVPYVAKKLANFTTTTAALFNKWLGRGKKRRRITY